MVNINDKCSDWAFLFFIVLGHHSIPSLVSPIRQKGLIGRIFLLDYVFIACSYLLLCISAMFAFLPGQLSVTSYTDVNTNLFVLCSSSQRGHISTTVMFAGFA